MQAGFLLNQFVCIIDSEPVGVKLGPLRVYTLRRGGGGAERRTRVAAFSGQNAR
jgi:hypothetical protein